MTTSKDRFDRVIAGRIDVLNTLTVGGTDLTAAIAEMAALDGVTATATELNKNAGVTAGTAAASKTAVLGANKNLDEFHTAALYLGAAAGTLMSATAAELNKVAGLSATGYLEVIESRSFTETTGAGVYTASVSVPAGSIILDVIWRNTALWTASSSATMKIGIVADDDGFFTGVDVKAAPSADGTGGFGGISCFKADTGAGAFSGKTVYNAGAVVVSGVVTTVGASGAAGRSLMVVRYVTPTATAATKV